jgi:hypothetical protein
MKRTFVGTAVAVLMAGTAFAAPSWNGSGSKTGTGDFALGIQVGEAQNGSNFSGITARVGHDRTLEGIFAFDGSTWILNGNFLVHGRNLFRQDPISAMRLYGGFGLGTWWGSEGGFWAQVPLGLDVDFSIPVEMSLYIAPGIDIVPSTQANLHFGLGVRYWFQ